MNDWFYWVMLVFWLLATITSSVYMLELACPSARWKELPKMEFIIALAVFAFGICMCLLAAHQLNR